MAPITTIMFESLTFPRALSLLSGLVCKACPIKASTDKHIKSFLLATVPWLLILYGPRIRTQSKFAKASFPTLVTS